MYSWPAKRLRGILQDDVVPASCVACEDRGVACCTRLCPCSCLMFMHCLQAQVMPVKEAKARFRRERQAFNDAKLSKCSPIIFFQTLEISLLGKEHIKSWQYGIEQGAHLKRRNDSNFRSALLQVTQFLCHDTAPRAWPCAAPCAVPAVPPRLKQALQPSGSEDEGDSEEGQGNGAQSDEAGTGSDADSESPRQQRPPKRPRAPALPSQAVSKQTTDQERSRTAILGGVSRDERHRRRQGASADASGSGSLVPSTAPAARSAPPLRRTRAATEPGRLSEDSKQAQVSAPAGSATAAPRGARAAAAQQADSDHAALPDDTALQRHDSATGTASGGNAALLGKRHTRSKGKAELDASDVVNLSPARKVGARRAGSGGAASDSKLHESLSARELTAEGASHPAVATAVSKPTQAPAPACALAVNAAALAAAASAAPPASKATAALLGAAARQSEVAQSAASGSKRRNGVVHDPTPGTSASLDAAAVQAAAVLASSSGAAAQTAADGDVAVSSEDATPAAPPSDADAEAFDTTRDGTPATDAEPGPAGDGRGRARRSRRDAPGRKSAAELLQGKGKKEEAKQLRQADSRAARQPAASKCAAVPLAARRGRHCSVSSLLQLNCCGHTEQFLFQSGLYGSVQ